MNYKIVIKQILYSIADFISAKTININLFKIKSVFLRPGRHKNLISLCLFGDGKKYFHNIDACLDSYKDIFPDWIIRIYVSADVNQTLITHLKQNAEVIIMCRQGIDCRYTLWRFIALDDTSVDKVLIRDIDSVASSREKQMVDQWIQSGKKMHVIRDHPDHSDRIMAGMWGIRTNGESQLFISKMLRFKKLDQFGIDQQFLKGVYTRYSPDIFINDIYKRFEDEEPCIILHDNNFHFVGEVNGNNPNAERQTNDLKNFYRQFQKPV